MVDFDEAVRRGMGFRVDVEPSQAGGFDRLFVLGVRLSADAREAQQTSRPVLNHHFGRAGFSLLPQGSPTNNTEEGGSGLRAHRRSRRQLRFRLQGQGTLCPKPTTGSTRATGSGSPKRSASIPTG